ncbi:hypothetical protein [Burkholderia pseudomallei]|uniref:hypothetical protein n=1 Tax=Burkholderia pseudomallei TaxID=28450 RepID=UPI0005371096|nr:hypothetical protein [Burkholderia pseudomallei]AJX22486.1 hypothetical protein BG17_1363 [Burkholderia pseudomallei MSHR491]KGW83230.1 hypothetical protein Y034_789 [Burkholderia pseudomallei MSHR449]KGX74492.1 hypothetical protein Y033_654 [Burkholderia pseudomallei MSHR435]
MTIENHQTYEAFCVAAHEELAAIARANVGQFNRMPGGFWEAIADASCTGILLSLCRAVRRPDVEEWPGVPQVDYEPLPELENRIGRHILDRPGPFRYEPDVAMAETMQQLGQPVNFPISPEGLARIRLKVAAFIELAAWRFFSEQQTLCA